METVKSSTPYTLLLTKSPEFVAQVSWGKAQADAEGLTTGVAEGEQLKAIMLDRHDDVLSARGGTKAFAFQGSLSIPFAVARDAGGDGTPLCMADPQ